MARRSIRKTRHRAPTWSDVTITLNGVPSPGRARIESIDPPWLRTSPQRDPRPSPPDDLVELAQRAVVTPSLDAEAALAVLQDALLELGLIRELPAQDVRNEAGVLLMRLNELPALEHAWAWAQEVTKR